MLILPPYTRAVRMHAKDRALREKVYRAYLSRASEFSAGMPRADGKGDNAKLIETILALRTAGPFTSPQPFSSTGAVSVTEATQLIPRKPPDSSHKECSE